MTYLFYVYLLRSIICIICKPVSFCNTLLSLFPSRSFYYDISSAHNQKNPALYYIQYYDARVHYVHVRNMLFSTISQLVHFITNSFYIKKKSDLHNVRYYFHLSTMVICLLLNTLCG